MSVSMMLERLRRGVLRLSCRSRLRPNPSKRVAVAWIELFRDQRQQIHMIDGLAGWDDTTLLEIPRDGWSYANTERI